VTGNNAIPGSAPDVEFIHAVKPCKARTSSGLKKEKEKRRLRKEAT